MADKWRGDSYEFNCNPVPVVLKKSKTSKNCYNLAPTCTKRAQWMGHMLNEKQVFVQKNLTKADQNLSKTFYFTACQLFWLNYEFFSNLCEGFSAKKGVIFSLKHLWRFYLFYLPFIASFTFSSALLFADTYITIYPLEFH